MPECKSERTVKHKLDQRKLMRTLTQWKLKQDNNTLVVGGYSMSPVINPGDFIHVKACPNCRVGDIVVVISQDARLLVHRVVRKNGTCFFTKGDNAVATERIEDSFCLGRVHLITNRNGKHQSIGAGSWEGKLLACLSRGMNRIWEREHNYRKAIGCRYRRVMLTMIPAKDKAFACAIEEDLFRLARMLTEEVPPDRTKMFTNNFTREHVKMMVQHQFLTLGYPYVIGCAGRWTKMLMLLKAQKRAGTLNLLKQCFRVSARLEEEGIPYAVIKGIPLSMAAYGNLFSRDSSDVDFLILPEDAQRVHTLLYEMGYRNHDCARMECFESETPPVYYPTHFYPYVIPEEGNGIELHTAQVLEEKFTGELLSRCERMKVEGTFLSVLNVTDSFLCLLTSVSADDYGCATTSYDEEPTMFLRLKLRNYVDILCFYSRQRDKIQETELIRRAIRYCCSFFTFFALSNAADLFHTDRFDSLLQQLCDAVPGFGLRNRLRLVTPVRKCLFDPLKMKTNGSALYQQHKNFCFRDLRLWYYGPDNPAMQQVMSLSTGENAVIRVTTEEKTLGCLARVKMEKDGLWVSFGVPADWPQKGEHVFAFCFLNPDGRRACKEYRWLFWCRDGKYTGGFYRIKDHCSVLELVKKEKGKQQKDSKNFELSREENVLFSAQFRLPNIDKRLDKFCFRSFYASCIIFDQEASDYIIFFEKGFSSAIRIESGFKS